MDLYERLADTAVAVNFDTAQPVVMGSDAVALLEHVKHKVFNVHAGDRLPGQRAHSVIGRGAVDFDGVFSVLGAIGYRRFISVEDGSGEGDEGTREAMRFLQRKIDRHWGPDPDHVTTGLGHAARR
jgi:sugar phosphate isomerase/epimerase